MHHLNISYVGYHLKHHIAKFVMKRYNDIYNKIKFMHNLNAPIKYLQYFTD
jgi:hypothetical protein